MLKKTIMLVLSTAAISTASDLPLFLDKDDVTNASFICSAPDNDINIEDQKYADVLWGETLQFLEGYAKALTTETVENCLYSDSALYDTSEGEKTLCITERRDVKNMIKNIYQILQNPDEAKFCFSLRKENNSIYSPGGDLKYNSSVDTQINRMTLERFFKEKVKDPKVQAYGELFYKNFHKMITGDKIKMPSTFPFDISANTLPNLWAASGWFPMYAEENSRNSKNFDNIRGGYAYSEILGPWGLLRIDTINGEKVGAEIGMTVQMVNSFYPYHNHATSESYYNIRIPSCLNQFKSFAIMESSPLLEVVDGDESMRRVQFDTGGVNSHTMWLSNSSEHSPLVYFHPNTIHAFEIDGSCESSADDKALVSIWSRTDAHDTRNDFGTTHLCESAENPGTPAKKGEIIQCDLTKVKW